MATIKKTGPGDPKKKKAVKKPNPKSYREWALDSETPGKTSVTGPKGYSKEIKYDSMFGKPYTMVIKKGGKTNEFSLTEAQAKRQRVIAKKEAGVLKKGGAVQMQKGGFVSKANAWLDKYFRDPINKAADKNLRKPASKLVSNINKAADKSFRDPINKAGQKLNKYLQKNISDPINNAAYNKKRKAVVKKVVTVKPKKGSEKRG